MAGEREGLPAGGSLGESRSSMVGLDEQRQSMVLELCCRKAERKREARKRERPAMAMWREGGREREGWLERKVRKVRA